MLGRSARSWGINITGRNSRVGAILVDLDGVHEPVRVFKVGRVVLDVGLARVGLGGAGGVRGPDLTGPVSAEGGVEDLDGILAIFQIMVF